MISCKNLLKSCALLLNYCSVAAQGVSMAVEAVVLVAANSFCGTKVIWIYEYNKTEFYDGLFLTYCGVYCIAVTQYGQ